MKLFWGPHTCAAGKNTGSLRSCLDAPNFSSFSMLAPPETCSGVQIGPGATTLSWR